MRDKLNIAMLGHKRIPSREGGIEIVVEELSTRMVKLGHRVTCFNRKGHHVSGSEFDVNQLSEYRGVKLKPVWTLDKKGLAAMTSSLSAAIKAAFGKYDVVHFHAEGPCAMLWIPKLFGKRCIATIHGIDWQRAKWGGFASKYIKFGGEVWQPNMRMRSLFFQKAFKNILWILITERRFLFRMALIGRLFVNRS